MSRELVFTKELPPCKEVQDGFGLWIPRRGFRIPGTGFQSLSLELGFWILIVSRIPNSLNCVPDFRTQDFGFQKYNFPWFQIPQAKIFRIPESVGPYMGREERCCEKNPRFYSKVDGCSRKSRAALTKCIKETPRYPT